MSTFGYQLKAGQFKAVRGESWACRRIEPWTA